MKKKTQEQLIDEIKKLNAKVAELKCIETKCEHTEEATMWQKAIDSSSDVVWILDKEHNILQTNSAVQSLFKKPCDGFIGKHCYEIVHGTTEPILECPFLRMKKTLKREAMELKINEKWFKVTVDPIFNKKNEYNGAIHYIADITERKKAEEALLLKNNVFDASIAAISTADTKGIINECNNSFLKLWGYSKKGEVYGKSISDFIEHNDEAVKIIDSINKTGVWEGEYIAKRKDNSTFIAYGLASDLHDSNNSLVGYQSSVTDITERKKIEEKLNARNTEMEILNKATVGRELVLIELKNEINKMLKKQEKKEKYKTPI